MVKKAKTFEALLQEKRSFPLRASKGKKLQNNEKAY